MISSPALMVVWGLLVGAETDPAALLLEGEVPEDAARYFTLPFTVPEGIVELEVVHDDLSSANILDFGLLDPTGFRGWGGGNSESAVVGLQAASRSYLPGPMPAGEWKVLVGEARVVERPARYRLEIRMRRTATLPPQPARATDISAPRMAEEARWYAGDFHVHSRESGDAKTEVSLDAIATFARGRGLDFVVLTDHNSLRQRDYLSDVQPRHPALLLIPGIEYTTYEGHALLWNAQESVDPRLSLQDGGADGLSSRVREVGGAFGVAHPVLDLDGCIGCEWTAALEPGSIDGYEIGSGGFSQGGFVSLPRVLKRWDLLLDKGARIAAVGGSDDHRAGVIEGPTVSPIGSPTTLVWAKGLSAEEIIAAVREGRTVVKLQGPDDPMVELTSGSARIGDTVAAPRSTLTVRVTGGEGTQVRLVKNGMAEPAVDVTSDPFEHSIDVEAPASGATDRWRAEVVGDYAPTGPLTPRTVTSHLYVTAPSPEESGCGCAGGHRGTAASKGAGLLVGGLAAGVGLLVMAWRTRRPRSPHRSPRA